MDQVADANISPGSPGQVIAYTGTAGTSAVLPPNAEIVWVFVTSIAHIRVSKSSAPSQTAVVTDIALPASWPVKIPLPGNDGTYKVSAVQSAAGGNLHICPIAY